MAGIQSVPFDTTTDIAALVAAPAGATQFVRVEGVEITGNGAVDAQFKSGSVVKWTAQFTAAGQSNVLPISTEGWFDVDLATALTLHVSAAVRVTGVVRYSIKG